MIFGGAPRFWWRPSGWQAGLLRPASALYGAAAARRLRMGAEERASVPVLCVGNFTAGGAGKTPTVLALAKAARAAGLRPGFLSRGHGGSAQGPLLVDPARHDAALTGDEPLLLACCAPAAIARDRAAGARLLSGEAGCDFILMDDGFQSARLHADLALLVVDGHRGLGNGKVLPGGPLRAPLPVQLAHADHVLVLGEGGAGEAAAATAAEAGLPVHRARIVPSAAPALVGPPLLAFAGIADPGKFYRSLAEIGAEVARKRDFPDHHPFTPAEIAALREGARREGLRLATTRKDEARLRSTVAGRELLAETLVLDVALDLAPSVGARLVTETLEAFAART